MRWSTWLMYCATGRKVGGSIPNGGFGIFHWHNFSVSLWPWGRLTLLRGKRGQCVGLTNLPFSCAVCLQIWEPQPPGSLGAGPGLSTSGARRHSTKTHECRENQKQKNNVRHEYTKHFVEKVAKSVSLWLIEFRHLMYRYLFA